LFNHTLEQEFGRQCIQPGVIPAWQGSLKVMNCLVLCTKRCDVYSYSWEPLCSMTHEINAKRATLYCNVNVSCKAKGFKIQITVSHSQIFIIYSLKHTSDNQNSAFLYTDRSAQPRQVQVQHTNCLALKAVKCKRICPC